MSVHHTKCEIARRNHNVESKTLNRLRENVYVAYVAKTELVTLMSMMKNVKADISHTDELVIKDILLSSPRCWWRETQYSKANCKLWYKDNFSTEMMKARHESEIVNLVHDIDEEYTKQKLLRRQYRSIIVKKENIICALIGYRTDIDHKRMQTAIENKSVKRVVSWINIKRYRLSLNEQKWSIVIY